MMPLMCCMFAQHMLVLAELTDLLFIACSSSQDVVDVVEVLSRCI